MRNLAIILSLVSVVTLPAFAAMPRPIIDPDPVARVAGDDKKKDDEEEKKKKKKGGEEDEEELRHAPPASGLRLK